MNFARARAAMVDSQVRTADVNDPALIAAMRALPRERFAPGHLRPLAYADLELEVAPGRFLLRPRDLAKLVDALGPRPGLKALEIAGATGYGAAVLAACGASVMTLDPDRELSFAANAALQGAGVVGATAVCGEAAAGWAEAAPYDLMLVNGGSEFVPQAWLEQLAPGGRLAVILRLGGAGTARLYTKSGANVAHRDLFDAAPPIVPGLERKRSFTF
jgi:protein-L-isoaspartate(D-aspartate) O-methyltransferase